MTEFMFVWRFLSHQTAAAVAKSVSYFLEQVVIPSTFFPHMGMIRYSTSICTALSYINTGAVRLHLGSGANDKTDPSWTDCSSMALRSTFRKKNCVRSGRECTYDIGYEKQKRWKGKTESPFASPVRMRTDLPRRGSSESWFIFMRLVEIIETLPSFWTSLPPVTRLLTQSFEKSRTDHNYRPVCLSVFSHQRTAMHGKENTLGSSHYLRTLRITIHTLLTVSVRQ